jgi:hypothetical protein
MKMHELLSDASKWTQRATARNADGEPCPANDRGAVRWCLLGAAKVCYPRTYMKKVFTTLMDKMPMSPVWWQDAPERTFGEVRGLLLELDI